MQSDPVFNINIKTANMSKCPTLCGTLSPRFDARNMSIPTLNGMKMSYVPVLVYPCLPLSRIEQRMDAMEAVKEEKER